jgi:hypothetical protein
VSPVGVRILVSNSPPLTVPATIAEFAPGADGDVAPIRTLGGEDHSRFVFASGITQYADGGPPVRVPLCGVRGGRSRRA